MRPTRFSVAGLMCFTAFVALAYLALASGSDLWLSVVVTVTLLVLALATVGAIVAPRPERVFWIGFAVLGWAYWLPMGVTALRGTIGGALFTTHAFTYIHWVLRPDVFRQTVAPQPFGLAWLPPEVQVFLLIGHSLVSLLIGWLGGYAALRLAGRSGSRDDAADRP